VLSPTEIADVIYQCNEVLPSSVLYNKPYSYEFLVSLLSIVGIRAYFSINYTEIRALIDGIKSTKGSLDIMINANASSAALGNTAKKLGDGIDKLSQVVQRESKQDSILIINDFLNNPLSARNRTDSKALDKDFFIEENEEYEKLIREKGSIQYLLYNPDNNTLMIKDETGGFKSIKLSDVIFTQDDIKRLNTTLNEDDKKGLRINEFFYKNIIKK